MSFNENNSREDSLLNHSFHSDSPFYGGTHFVGTPDQITPGESSTPHIRPIPTIGFPPSPSWPSQRPRLQQRSVSLNVSQTLPQVNATQSLRESFSRMSLASPSPSEPQWSLFEQL